ncbi:MAG: DUF4397 domain-containing protein, partial [Ignavibacteriae bacterium]|nr:DUF4397 domain-containing protein [Ignavibacteriota bacterium]
MCKKIIFYILLFSLSVVTGCIGENPNLLNPPPQTSSMNVRFVNLCKDEPALRLLMNNTVQSGLTPYATCSDTVHPPADSVGASVTLDGTEKYKRKNKVWFLYKTYYSLIALPSAPGDSIQRTVDTIISIGTISSFTNRFNTAYVKVMNALPDTTYRFSVVLGCPNGNSIVQSLRYRGIGPAIELPAGDEAISVLTERAGSAPDINLYRLQFKAGGQYTIIIYGISSGKPDLLLLDEFGGINALSNINSIPSDEKYAKVRTINFSNQQVTVKKKSNPDEIISDNVQSGFISSYSN